MAYKIEPDNANRDSFGNYQFRVFKDGRLVAHFWHDYRGDEHGIDFANGVSEGWPVGRLIEFVEGGGRQPLVFTARGIAYMDQKTLGM
ncbi:hypothetical protein P5Y53_08890 [Dyella jiangningensis]|jgi:hypothetical protein|uniref:hypothetical protein n=1 Tax=Dyella jiangningensis TaxID=1379159 RepID=UPI00240F411E|nr:hypothetical protein [Dyella jiangningensis]MDG2537774.1 hypothetical protein [Dyella jiangningensis]